MGSSWEKRGVEEPFYQHGNSMDEHTLYGFLQFFATY